MITEDTYQILHRACRNFIDDNCLVRDTKMPGKKPGTYYTWMFYLRRGLFHPEFVKAISNMFLYRVQQEVGHFNFQLAGVETASTPMLTAIPLIAGAYRINLNAFSIRKTQKEYGLKNWTEGLMIDDYPCMLIDDLCNSSNSMRHGYNVLQDLKLPVFDYAFVIVNKVNKEVHNKKREETDMYLPENIKIIHLYDLDDFGLSNPSH